MFEGIADRGFLNLVARFYAEADGYLSGRATGEARAAYRRVLEAAVGVPEASRLIDIALENHRGN